VEATTNDGKDADGGGPLHVASARWPLVARPPINP
jgi:hypothetical protein